MDFLLVYKFRNYTKIQNGRGAHRHQLWQIGDGGLLLALGAIQQAARSSPAEPPEYVCHVSNELKPTDVEQEG